MAGFPEYRPSLPEYVPPRFDKIVSFEPRTSLRAEDLIDTDSIQRQVRELSDGLVLAGVIDWLRTHGFVVIPPDEDPYGWMVNHGYFDEERES